MLHCSKCVNKLVVKYIYNELLHGYCYLYHFKYKHIATLVYFS